MLALEIQKFELNPNVILQDPLNDQLLGTLYRFSQVLKNYGFDVQVASKKSLLRLDSTPAEQKKAIIRNFEQWMEWIRPESNEKIIEVDSELEKRFLRKALDFYGYTVDDEFWKTLDESTVIEVYSPEMVQLYRNLNFFKVTNYALLDLTINEWYVLWERPKLILEKLVNYAKESVCTKIPVKKMEIPKHVLREVLNTGDTEPFIPSASIAEFLHVGSVTSKATGEVTGFICTARGGKIAEGQEALDIMFV